MVKNYADSHVLFDPARAINPRPELSPVRNGPDQFRAARSQPGSRPDRTGPVFGSNQARAVSKKTRAGSGRPENYTTTIKKPYGFLQEPSHLILSE
jgi:hypothetical protein